MTLQLLPLRRAALALALILCAFLTTASPQQTDCNVRVTLLQVNDVYQFSPVDQNTTGGLARVLTLKQKIQKESPNTLFLLAGDTISPSVESITYKGAQMIDAWNTIGLDYATFGNHEFDFGPDVLKTTHAGVEVWLDRCQRHRHDDGQTVWRRRTVRHTRV